MFRRYAKLTVALLALAGGALAIGACGGGDEENFNQTDATFTAQMLPHHEHAIEMAELAVAKSSNQGVKDLAQGIIDTQEQEITQLTGFLEEFDEAPAEPAPEVMALNEGVIGELQAESGAAFDELFLKEMSAHHSSAIDMAGIEIAGGEYEEAVSLAESIESTQLAEIAEMQELMATVPG